MSLGNLSGQGKQSAHSRIWEGVRRHQLHRTSSLVHDLSSTNCPPGSRAGTLISHTDAWLFSSWLPTVVSRFPVEVTLISVTVSSSLPSTAKCLGSEMFMLSYRLQVKSLCASLLDSNVLVQRNNLEIVLFFFPFYTCLVSHLCASTGVPGVSWGHGAGGLDLRATLWSPFAFSQNNFSVLVPFCEEDVSIAKTAWLLAVGIAKVQLLLRTFFLR